MLKAKTHFEQIPLEAVRKIVREQIQREALNDGGINEEMLEKALAAMEEQSMRTYPFLTRSDGNH